MTKNFKKIISLFLCLTILLPTSVYANYDEVYYNSSDGILFSNVAVDTKEQEECTREYISNMTPEAQEILFDYFAQEEPDLYVKYIDAASSSISNRNSVRSYSANSSDASARAAARNEMAILGSRLRSIGVTGALYTQLMAIGAEIASAIGLTVGGLLAVLFAVAVGVVIITNWDTFDRKFDKIVDAFVAAFPSKYAIIRTAFQQARAQYRQVVKDTSATKEKYRTAKLTESAVRHVDGAFISTFLKNRDNKEYKIYYSTKKRVSLIVMKIAKGKGNKASLNKKLSNQTKNGKYDVTDYDLGGFTMYIMYDCVRNEIYHCHVRLGGDDTHEMRRHNSLDLMIFPTRQRNMQYHNVTSAGLSLKNEIIP